MKIILKFISILLSRLIYTTFCVLFILLSAFLLLITLPISIIVFMLDSKTIYSWYEDMVDYDFSFIVDWGEYLSTRLRIAVRDFIK